ncbi:hypothetical protein TNCV_961391 [Trichonephila clavipes]|uniref:Uncharacterized protein n=1 Tax=Trichonephila clavipes TaxID=2585209 RepID=A0A8X6S245_TRICX|nr:hypothetical protein TNCV_961391 [Trichonephila clavipes]
MYFRVQNIPNSVVKLKSTTTLKGSDYVRNRDFSKAYKWIIFMIFSVVTFYHKVHDFTLIKLTAILQSTIVQIADASCTPIGPPLLKSRPTLQAQVSKTKNIRVPDRGLKAAGAA